jgi:hypothetical protein
MEMLMAGWGRNNRRTKPLDNSLLGIAASHLTANDVKYLLTRVNISSNLKKHVLHRAKNLGTLRNFMREYQRNENSKRRARNLQRQR